MGQPETTEGAQADAASARLLERQNRELAILNAIATRLNESVDLGELLGAALASVADLLGLRTAWVWLLDEETNRFVLAASQNLPAGMEEHPESLRGPCLCLRTYRRGGLQGAVNVLTCSRLKSLPDGTEGLRFHASIPLRARNRGLGLLNVAAAEWRELTAEELRVLHTAGDMLGTSIERARLFQRSVALGAAEERLRLAREMHDTIAQGLSATALHLETAEALLEAGAAAASVRDAVRHALATTRENLEDARRSVLDLRASSLEGRTLAQALAALCETSGTAASVAFGCEGTPTALPARVEGGLYRIAQEAVTNALRHAEPAQVRVQLAFAQQSVRLSVEDDGRGFEPGTTPADHFGLIGMRERVRLLGGELYVESAPRRGTRILAEVPLP